MHQRFAGMFVGSASEQELDTLRDAALSIPDEIFEQWLRKEWPSYDLTNALGSIQLPVLAVLGAKDIVVTPQRQYEDAMRLPRSKVVTFKDAGHLFPLESPVSCTNEVLRFFQDLR